MAANSRFPILVLAGLSALTLAACTTVKQSAPARTGSEEMLISTAADRAAAKITPHIPKDAKVFIDATYFEGTDSKYAIAAIRGSLLQQGIKLTDDKKAADVVVEIRAGALSTDQKSMLIGIPSFTVPVPLAATGITTPELDLYKTDEQKGVAKFAATVYSAKTLKLAAAPEGPQYGFSHDTKHTVLFFISWETNDAVPDEDDPVARALSPTSGAADGGDADKRQ